MRDFMSRPRTISDLCKGVERDDLRYLCEYKRNGVAGTYVVLVEVSDVRGAEIKIRPLFHTWTPSQRANPRSRWVSSNRVRPLSAYWQEKLLQEGLPFVAEASNA